MTEKIPNVVKKAHRSLPHFKDGRIDYSEAEIAPVVVVIVKWENEILLLKRSQEVRTNRGRWGFVAGYMDELKPVVEKGIEELKEETGITKNEVSSISRKGVYRWEYSEGGIEFISHLVLAVLDEKPRVSLSWEHTSYRWVEIDKASNLLSSHTLAELEKVIQ